MKEFVEKLIERLEEEVKSTREMQTIQCVGNNGYGTPLQAKLSGEISALLKTINIVNRLAEEYTSTEHINCSTDTSTDLISRSAVIKELNGIYLDNPWDDKEDILEKAIAVVDHMPAPYVQQ